jgi:hypothetical protein
VFSKGNLSDKLIAFLNFSGERFENIKKNGLKDKLDWNNETEGFILGDVLK